MSEHKVSAVVRLTVELYEADWPHAELADLSDADVIAILKEDPIGFVVDVAEWAIERRAPSVREGGKG